MRRILFCTLWVCALAGCGGSGGSGGGGSATSPYRAVYSGSVKVSGSWEPFTAEFVIQDNGDWAAGYATGGVNSNIENSGASHVVIQPDGQQPIVVDGQLEGWVKSVGDESAIVSAGEDVVRLKIEALL